MKNLRLFVLFLLISNFTGCDSSVDNNNFYVHSGTGTYLFWTRIEDKGNNALYMWQSSNSGIDRTIVEGSLVDFEFEVQYSEMSNNGMRYYGKLLTMKRHN